MLRSTFQIGLSYALVFLAWRRNHGYEQHPRLGIDEGQVHPSQETLVTLRLSGFYRDSLTTYLNTVSIFYFFKQEAEHSTERKAIVFLCCAGDQAPGPSQARSVLCHVATMSPETVLNLRALADLFVRQKC